MKIYIDNYEDLVLIRSAKIICVDLPIKINQNLKRDIKFTIICNEFLTKYKIKNETSQLLFKYGHEYGHEYKKRTELFI